jgi:hypothetical protein
MNNQNLEADRDQSPTLVGEQLDERRLKWRDVCTDCPILQLELQVNRSEMRQPSKLLVRFEGRESLSILILKPRWQ